MKIVLFFILVTIYLVSCETCSNNIDKVDLLIARYVNGYN